MDETSQPAFDLKARTWTFTYPDGIVASRTSYFRPTDDAVAYVYQYLGNWYCACIGRPDAPHMKHYQSVPAKVIP